jgi:hypothetical protein
VLLSAASEHALSRLLDVARRAGIRCSAFREPDLEGALTSIALEPGAPSRRLCRELPLMLDRGG